MTQGPGSTSHTGCVPNFGCGKSEPPRAIAHLLVAAAEDKRLCSGNEASRAWPDETTRRGVVCQSTAETDMSVDVTEGGLIAGASADAVKRRANHRSGHVEAKSTTWAGKVQSSITDQRLTPPHGQVRGRHVSRESDIIQGINSESVPPWESAGPVPDPCIYGPGLQVWPRTSTCANQAPRMGSGPPVWGPGRPQWGPRVPGQNIPRP